MHPSLVSISCSAILLLACARSEPSLVPLGLGPLARAQREAEATTATSSDTRSADAGAKSTRRVNTSQRPITPNVAQTAPTTSERSDGGDKPDAARVVPTAAPSQRPGMPDEVRPRIEDWVGLYRGNDTTVFKTTGQTERRFDDPKAKIRVEQTGKTRLDFVLVDSSNDQDMCRLSATVDGDAALIEAGQSCFLETEDEMSAKSRPGKAVRKDRQLSLDLVLDTTMMNDETPVTGAIEYHFDGKR